MGIFSQPADDGPNAKQYELRYQDGDRFRFDRPGREPLKTFNLAIAIQMANHEAGSGTQLYVVDPETNTVLWTGQRAMR
jgi:hypothetical protein